MNFKKRVNSSWVDAPHYIHKTDTDILTTLPDVVYVNDTTATVGLKGNTVQSGTPTPQNPIMPQGCGDLETVGTKAGQYKIPILSNSIATSVYLGEVETMRKIRELVLTGEETFVRSGSGDSAFYRMILSDSARTDSLDSSLCSHFTYNTISSSNTDIGFFILSDGLSVRIRPNDVSSSTLQTFTTWLSQQYAAGTPVTVWYVLATPTTGIVNEPIRKIGDYADTVSGITIPTTEGANSFDVLTTLKPSEVTVNYKGWHTGAVHERDGGQWN